MCYVYVLLRLCKSETYPTMDSKRYSPECSAMGMGQFPIFKLKWNLLRTSFTACEIDENTFSALFGIFYVRMEI